MTLQPLIQAPFEIQIHVFFAIFAIVLGPIALFRKRKDRIHKVIGYVWVIAMFGLALSALFIKGQFAIIGYFGPIHLLSIVTFYSLVTGLHAILNGNVVGHQARMKSLWFGAVGLAGLFTLLPGRMMNKVVFGDIAVLGWVAIAIGLFWIYRVGRKDLTPVARDLIGNK